MEKEIEKEKLVEMLKAMADIRPEVIEKQRDKQESRHILKTVSQKILSELSPTTQA